MSPLISSHTPFSRMTPKDDIQLSLQSYAKILCHVMQYQYTACNGVLLTADKGEEEEEGRLEVVDVVPLFHYNLPLAPMFIVALTQVTLTLSNTKLLKLTLTLLTLTLRTLTPTLTLTSLDRRVCN